MCDVNNFYCQLRKLSGSLGSQLHWPLCSDPGQTFSWTLSCFSVGTSSMAFLLSDELGCLSNAASSLTLRVPCLLSQCSQPQLLSPPNFLSLPVHTCVRSSTSRSCCATDSVDLVRGSSPSLATKHWSLGISPAKQCTL